MDDGGDTLADDRSGLFSCEIVYATLGLDAKKNPSMFLRSRRAPGGPMQDRYDHRNARGTCRNKGSRSEGFDNILTENKSTNRSRSAS